MKHATHHKRQDRIDRLFARQKEIDAAVQVPVSQVSHPQRDGRAPSGRTAGMFKSGTVKNRSG